MTKPNILLQTDSYKISHHLQYPPNTEVVHSYLEARAGGCFKNVLFFGLQYILKKYLEGVRVTEQSIKQAKIIFKAHFGNDGIFNESGWRYILKKHGGRLPVHIRAVPEGTLVPEGNVLMTIENTDPNCFWLTNYLETLLLQVWYPTTVATNSYFQRQILLQHLKETGDPALVDFKLHDFGYRGVSSQESAAIGGAAHLISFQGTDTLAALIMLQEFYGADIAGFSIPATEHSTITSWGEDHEVDAMRNMLTKFPTGIIACVSDSYNIYRACNEYWGEKLKNLVLQRDGVLVIRPDSGHPPSMVIEVLEELGKAFGYDNNAKGYKVLNSKVRVIQGDGIDYKMMAKVLDNMKKHGWSTDNIAFGSGGGLLQKVNRDTQRFALKCSAIRINGQWQDVAKNPVSDPTKISKAGRLKLVREKNQFKTMRTDTGWADYDIDALVDVFLDGKVLNTSTLQQIRKRAL